MDKWVSGKTNRRRTHAQSNDPRIDGQMSGLTNGLANGRRAGVGWKEDLHAGRKTIWKNGGPSYRLAGAIGWRLKGRPTLVNFREKDKIRQPAVRPPVVNDPR